MSTIPGPWRGLTLSSAAPLVGCAYATMYRAKARGHITTTGGYKSRVSWREVRRFVQTPACWVIVHPREIADLELRAIAVEAWRAAGEPRWYASADLCQHYRIGKSTLCRWRERRQWPRPDAWHWQGGTRAGDYWLVWVGPLPPPPADLRRER